MECCFIYTLADFASSFKPHTHLSSPRLIYLIFYFFFLKKDKSGLKSTLEDALLHSNTITGISDLTGIGETSLEARAWWEGFTEFI